MGYTVKIARYGVVLWVEDTQTHWQVSTKILTVAKDCLWVGDQDNKLLLDWEHRLG